MAIELIVDAALCFLAIVFAAGTILVTASGTAVPITQVLLPAALVALMMSAIYTSLGIYRRDQTLSSSARLIRALIALLLGCLPIYYLFDLFVDGGYARHVIGYALVYMMAGLVALRLTLPWANNAAFGKPRVLILGIGAEARDVAADIRSHSSDAYKLVGFFPSGIDETNFVGARARVFRRDLGLEEVVARHRVNEIVVAIKEQRGGVLPLRQLLECRISGIPVRSMAQFYERSHGEVPLDSLKASWLIFGGGFVQHPFRTAVKRAFDLVTCLLLFAVSWPFMLVAAVMIKLEDGGPVLFRQERVGYTGRSFTILKFRSMRVDAERDGIARWAAKDDSRITRVGRFLRKTRIDELPQLLNVLKGDMSLVGPRPERPSFVSDLESQVPFYDIRHSVKPGVTGWAQVRFSYGASIDDARRKLQFDLYYVKNHSLWLDLLVIFETIRVVLLGKGAH
jgi:sugar transferase (PEP-CTERM system associated)